MIFRLVFLPENVVFLEARLDTIISIVLAAPEIAERSHAVSVAKEKNLTLLQHQIDEEIRKLKEAGTDFLH